MADVTTTTADTAVAAAATAAVTPTDLEFDLGNGNVYKGSKDQVQEILKQANAAFQIVQDLKAKNVLDDKFQYIAPTIKEEKSEEPDQLSKLQKEIEALRAQTSTDKFLDNLTRTMQQAANKFDITKDNELARGLVESVVIAKGVTEGTGLNVVLAYESTAKVIDKIVQGEVKKILEQKAKQSANPGEGPGGADIFKMEKAPTREDMKNGTLQQKLAATLASLETKLGA
jgi:vacuolar-type H+-ATPase subunit I/STV1